MPQRRFAFYERAKKAFLVVYTSEAAQYANIILKKGCIKEPLAQ
jgi:L-fucose mutarotase